MSSNDKSKDDSDSINQSELDLQVEKDTSSSKSKSNANISVEFSEKVKNESLLLYGTKCPFCKCNLALNRFDDLKEDRKELNWFHHVYFKALGGGGGVDNCLPVCYDCHKFFHKFADLFDYEVLGERHARWNNLLVTKVFILLFTEGRRANLAKKLFPFYNKKLELEHFNILVEKQSDKNKLKIIDFINKQVVNPSFFERFIMLFLPSKVFPIKMSFVRNIRLS